MDPGSPSGPGGPGKPRGPARRERSLFLSYAQARLGTATDSHASDLQPRSPLSASHLRVGCKHHAWGEEKLKELSSVIQEYRKTDTGINDVICILTALGAPVGEDYHRIFKTTSSEGSLPALAPGRLQKQGRKEAPLQGVLPSLGATMWPASLSQGPLLGWALEHSAAPSGSGFSAVMGPLNSCLLGSSST